MTAATAVTAPARAAEDLGGDLAYARGDYHAAAIAWGRAAVAGDVSAMAGVAALYDTGHGVAQDFARALEWYRRSAEAGNVPSMLSVAAMYDNGRGAPVDRVEAVRWYTMAAEHGSGRAAYDLGVIYRQGDGVPRSTPDAIRFFRMAASDGIAAARPNLAALGDTAPAIPRPVSVTPPVSATDRQAADITRFERAALDRSDPDTLSVPALRAVIPTLDQRARGGNGAAAYDMGFAYERGLGVPADLVKAYTFYLRAAASKNGAVNTAALKGAAETGNRLTPDQHAAARDALLGGS